MAIEFIKESDCEIKINNGFDDFCNVKIRKHSLLGVSLDFEDFYGEFSLEDLEEIVEKMKEFHGVDHG
jgi:hypothetical protein